MSDTSTDLEKVIEISNHAVADYGFRQAVLYGASDIGRRWELGNETQGLLEGTVLSALAALPIPVEPADIEGEQVRLADMIREVVRSCPKLLPSQNSPRT